MKTQIVLSILLAAALLGAGCMDSSRDIDREAKDREKYARDNDDHDVVVALSGPQNIAPGALVWYSAYGSHDPDFLGATSADLRDDEPGSSGNVRYEDDVSNINLTWYTPMFKRDNDGLGTGIRSYAWQVDGGPALHSFDLTHRYGSDDGPIRFPVGFTEEGSHTLRLSVTGWDGSRDVAEMDINVQESGTTSTVSGWHVTEDGWTHNRSAELEPQDFGECPPGSSSYDAPTHRVSTPWDLIYWMGEVRVVATWDPITEGTMLPLPDAATLNVADVEITLGHCAQDDGAWQRFSQDQGPTESDPRVEGTASGGEFVDHLDVDGKRTDKTGAWDFNVYHSDSGTHRGGLLTTVDVGFVFIPAEDTSAGGL